MDMVIHGRILVSIARNSNGAILSSLAHGSRIVSIKGLVKSLNKRKISTIFDSPFCWGSLLTESRRIENPIPSFFHGEKEPTTKRPESGNKGEEDMQ